MGRWDLDHVPDSSVVETMTNLTVPNYQIRMLEDRKGTEKFMSVDDMIAWAYKGALENTDESAHAIFIMIAKQFEKLRDD